MVGALLSLLYGSAAWAETATGRVTYISPDRQQLILDSNDVYSAGAQGVLSKVAVADRVKIAFEKHGAQRIIGAAALAPLTSNS
jgi:hypothetical protein